MTGVQTCALPICKFYEWLKSGEIDKEFERDQKLTVWAVDNETFDMYHNFGEKDSLAIRYHVNNLSFAKSNLRDGLRIKTLCNIYLQININSKDEGDVISVNNVADVKEVYSTQNGTIYVLDNMLMPRVSIYDYLVTLDDRYSIIRDTIFKHNRELFDKVNSTPIGVDKTGNTVYDTVTYIDNPLFATANFISEFEQFTTLLRSEERRVGKEC